MDEYPPVDPDQRPSPKAPFGYLHFDDLRLHLAYLADEIARTADAAAEVREQVAKVARDRATENHTAAARLRAFAAAEREQANKLRSHLQDPA